MNLLVCTRVVAPFWGLAQLRTVALAWDHQPMLARTHGQPATPTRVGKEMMVFVER
jgi:adenylosuccinate lyase